MLNRTTINYLRSLLIIILRELAYEILSFQIIYWGTKQCSTGQQLIITGAGLKYLLKCTYIHGCSTHYGLNLHIISHHSKFYWRPVCCMQFGEEKNYIDFFKFKNLFRDNYKVKSLNE